MEGSERCSDDIVVRLWGREGGSLSNKKTPRPDRSGLQALRNRPRYKLP